MYYSQEEYLVRCEWGGGGVQALAPISDVLIIVDVLSFSTCVTIAVERGGTIWPCLWKDESAADFARSVGAELAGSRGQGGYSLSPTSLLGIPSGTGLVLPSPNGSTLTLGSAAHGKVVLAGCLRNAGAVARAARSRGETIALIPAGERWPDGTLRPALEDLLGVGAIIAALEAEFPSSSISPEALAAAATFRAMRSNLRDQLLACSSGRELVERNFENDVLLAAEHDASDCVPTGEYGTGLGFRYSGRNVSS